MASYKSQRLRRPHQSPTPKADPADARMTSTQFNVGLTDNPRVSSRVLRPPGGGHTDIFGGEPEPTRGRRAGPPQPASQIGQGDTPKPTNGTPTEAPAPALNGQDHPSPAPQEPKPESSKQDFSNAKQESTIAKQNSPITPEPVENPKVDIPKTSLALGPQEPVRAEPAKRVRVPPGGFSSGLW